MSGVIARVTAGAAVLLTILTLAPPGLAPAGAAQAQAAAMQLRSQTPYVPAEGEFQVVFDWTGDLSEELTIGGTIYAAVTSEAGVTETPLTPFARLPETPLEALPRTAEGSFVFEVGIRNVEEIGTDRIRIREAGVFPVVVEILDAEGTPVAALRTNLIRLPLDAAESQAIPVAVTLYVSSAEGLTIDKASEILARHPTLPIAVEVGDGVVTQLENDPDAAARFERSMAGRPVIAPPNRDLDPSALADIERGDLYGEALEESRARLRALGLQPSPSIVPVESNLTSRGVVLLGELGIDTVIDRGSIARPLGVMSTAGDELAVVSVDDEITAQIARSDRAIERAHRLLATLAIRNTTDLSPIVIGGPGLRSVGLEALDTLLTALDGTGPIVNVDLGVVAEQAAFRLRPDEQPTQNLTQVAPLIEDFSATLETYRTFFVTGQRPPEVFQSRLLEALSRTLNPDDRLRAVDRLQTNLDQALQGIELPAGQQVTLAVQRAEIPITVDNKTDGIRRVLVTFESDKIRVAQNETIIELEPGVSTIDIDLEALSLGQSPLEVTIQTPDATTQLAATRFGVRSTAVPGLGFVLSITALVFLIGWWARTWRRERRAKRTLGAVPA